MNTHAAPSILVIDSGIGGLSVCNAITKKQPQLTINFCLDNAYFPYGNKTEAFIQQRLIDLVQYFYNHICKPDLVVIACNTASTTVLPLLREKFDLPFVGVVPAIKPACEKNQSKHVVLLATSGTVEREYTKNLISQFANGSAVSMIGCDELVTLAETKMSGHTINQQDIKHALGNISQYQLADYIVLGCTHFPFLIDELKPNFADTAHFIDSGDAIARRVESLLQDEAQGNSQDRLQKKAQEKAHNNTPNNDQIKTAFFTATNKQQSAEALTHNAFTISQAVIDIATSNYGHSA